MKFRLGFKFAIVVGVLVLLQIPILMIQDQVSERNYTRFSVVDEISRSWGPEQRIIGPILFVPYETIKKEKVWDKKLNQYRDVERTIQHTRLIAPESSHVLGRVEVTQRKRGIYDAPVYTSHLKLTGKFDLAPLQEINGTIGSPELIVMMSDLTGVLTIPSIQVNQKTIDFTEGGLKNSKGMKAEIKEWVSFSDYEFDLDLKGSQRISMYPLAKNNVVDLNSNWAHPSFNGLFLPESYQIATDGFTARWRTTSLASNTNQLLNHCARGDCGELMDASYGVTFFEPVNNYTMSDRSAKYAILLIITTFAIFFILETLKSAAVHPVQYLLVGLSLTIFNLLLVALTEHISFLASYAISAFACLALLTAYAHHILRRISWLLAFIAVLSSLFVLMYFILLSEDYAFLMGSGFLFLILAALMLATRKVDWYQISAGRQGLEKGAA